MISMHNTIGNAAGIIWPTLADSAGPLNITDIPKRTNLTTQIAFQGLGWLAKEGKIQYEKKGRSVYVSLASI